MRTQTEHIGARVPRRLVTAFDEARKLDRRDRSNALRVAMEGYVNEVARREKAEALPGRR
jgi:metal-responsive CopG/Arc/MetJ family transcriptional regulator